MSDISFSNNSISIWVGFHNRRDNPSRLLTYISNIMVVKDPANPQNEGGVFLYKFGKKIFDKLMSAMQPEFEDELFVPLKYAAGRGTVVQLSDPAPAGVGSFDGRGEKERADGFKNFVMKGQTFSFGRDANKKTEQD